MVDKDEVAIIKIVGGRMAEARALCKLPRHVAAERLGIADDLLAKIEEGVDVETMPLKLVRQASLVYDVSVDFLFGFSNDWEVTEETKQDREFAAYLHQAQTQLFSRWAVKQMRLERQVEAMAPAAGTLTDEIEAIVEALNTFKGMNPEFDKLPAGSMLQYRINRAGEKANEARRALIRHQVTPL
jgi:transcriptional regulator with XRE-family HTH domain